MADNATIDVDAAAQQGPPVSGQNGGLNPNQPTTKRFEPLPGRPDVLSLGTSFFNGRSFIQSIEIDGQRASGTSARIYKNSEITFIGRGLDLLDTWKIERQGKSPLSFSTIRLRAPGQVVLSLSDIIGSLEDGENVGIGFFASSIGGRMRELRFVFDYANPDAEEDSKKGKNAQATAEELQKENRAGQANKVVSALINEPIGGVVNAVINGVGGAPSADAAVVPKGALEALSRTNNFQVSGSDDSYSDAVDAQVLASETVGSVGQNISGNSTLEATSSVTDTTRQTSATAQTNITGGQSVSGSIQATTGGASQSGSATVQTQSGQQTQGQATVDSKTQSNISAQGSVTAEQEAASFGQVQSGGGSSGSRVFAGGTVAAGAVANGGRSAAVTGAASKVNTTTASGQVNQQSKSSVQSPRPGKGSGTVQDVSNTKTDADNVEQVVPESSSSTNQDSSSNQKPQNLPQPGASASVGNGQPSTQPKTQTVPPPLPVSAQVQENLPGKGKIDGVSKSPQRASQTPSTPEKTSIQGSGSQSLSRPIPKPSGSGLEAEAVKANPPKGMENILGGFSRNSRQLGNRLSQGGIGKDKLSPSGIPLAGSAVEPGMLKEKAQQGAGHEFDGASPIQPDNFSSEDQQPQVEDSNPKDEVPNGENKKESPQNQTEGGGPQDEAEQSPEQEQDDGPANLRQAAQAKASQNIKVNDTKLQELANEASRLMNGQLMVWSGAAWASIIGIPLGMIVGDFLWLFKDALIRTALNKMSMTSVMKEKSEEIAKQVKISGMVKLNIVGMNLVSILVVVLAVVLIMFTACNFASISGMALGGVTGGAVGAVQGVNSVGGICSSLTIGNISNAISGNSSSSVAASTAIPNSTCQSVASGDASIANLTNSCFGSANAQEASAIVLRESTGNPTVPSQSDICHDSSGNKIMINGQYASVSFGLFQINITVHQIAGLNCPAAFSYPAGVKVKEYDANNNQCTIIDPALYTACAQAAETSQANIAAACQISNNGANFNAWSPDVKACGFAH